MDLSIAKASYLKGTIRVPGDKSVSHRALILGALSRGETLVEGFLPSEDCWSTANCLRALGVSITQAGSDTLRVVGKGLEGLREPETILDAGNSGTTMRLMLGVLAGSPFFSVLTGDSSLRRRPMARVTRPLTEMGALIWGRAGGSLAPLCVNGSGGLLPLDYRLPVASAQVKSAVLLAGLAADGVTRVSEPSISRDHTERMLGAFGAEISREDEWICLRGKTRLSGQKVRVPADISSAAFFLVAGLLVNRSEVRLDHVGLNPTRTGLLDVLRAMGGRIEIEPDAERSGEPVGNLWVRSSKLAAATIGGSMIPRLIDEVPVLAVAATQAEGTTVIQDAAELAVKETNRLKVMEKELSRMGAKVRATSDGLIIDGPTRLTGVECDSHGDHRVAMALAVAGLVADGVTTIHGAECISVSFPGFINTLKTLLGGGA